MTLTVTHPYVSSIAESTASGVAGGLVGPNEWNANHTLTGIVSPAQGGTGITSGTGVTYFSSATVIADSGTLTANAVVLGGGANGAPTVVASVGTTSQVLFGGAGGGAPQWAAAPGGGSPGGAATDVQFASSGSTFSGDGSFTYAGAGAGVTIKLSSSTSTAGLSALSIVTSSSSNMASNTSALNITSLWNNSATAFDAPLFMNITNTASASASKIFDFQVGGNSFMSANSDGSMTIAQQTGAITGQMLTLKFGGNIQFNFTSGGAANTASMSMNNATSGGINFNNASGIINFGGASTILGDGTFGVNIGNATNANALRVYNTVDTLSSPTNYERGVFDWTTTANTLTIGTQAGGTGTNRSIDFVVNSNSAQYNFRFGAAFSTFTIGKGTAINIYGGWQIGFTNGTDAGANFPDTSIFRTAPAVVAFGAGLGSLTGWMQWAGEARVSANSTTTSTAMANVPGLAFKPQANRNYSFEAHLIFTDAATGGIQCTVNATSTTTTYTLTFDGWVTDTTAVRGYAQGSAFGNVVASSLTTGTLGHVTITGTLMTSATAPSTVTIQFAQNTSNATATTVLIGSYMWAHDIP